jgi:hypothetical protein
LKKAIFSALTLIVIIFINYVLSKALNVLFVDMSFITGLFFTSIIGYFSTDDSIYNRFLGDWAYLVIDRNVSNNYNLRFFNSIPFCVSFIYTIISFIITAYLYWHYFF